MCPLAQSPAHTSRLSTTQDPTTHAFAFENELFNGMPHIISRRVSEPDTKFAWGRRVSGSDRRARRQACGMHSAGGLRSLIGMISCSVPRAEKLEAEDLTGLSFFPYIWCPILVITITSARPPLDPVGSDALTCSAQCWMRDQQFISRH